MDAAGYDGLFPPDSVTWQVPRRPAAVGRRAPGAAAASGPPGRDGRRAAAFGLPGRPWGRLFRTAGYVGTVSSAPAQRWSGSVPGSAACTIGCRARTRLAGAATEPAMPSCCAGSTAARSSHPHRPPAGRRAACQRRRSTATTPSRPAPPRSSAWDPATMPDSAAAIARLLRADASGPQRRPPDPAARDVPAGAADAPPGFAPDTGPAGLGAGDHGRCRHAAALGPPDVRPARAAHRRPRGDGGPARARRGCGPRARTATARVRACGPPGSRVAAA